MFMTENNRQSKVSLKQDHFPSADSPDYALLFPGEKYLNLRQISNFCQDLPAWLSKFFNFSLIGIHPTYHFHIAIVLKVQQICRCFVAKN
jgi:hypothetical protein